MKNRIQELRKEKNLTLKELGNELGIRDNTLSQYETGKRSANIGVFMTIANYFGVSVDYLLCNDDTKEYPAENEEDILNIIEKIDKRELVFDNLPNETLIKIRDWALLNKEKVSKEMLSLITVYCNASDALKKISLSREEKDRNDIQKINATLNDLHYEGATPKQVLQFIKLSEFLDTDDINFVFSVMKKFKTMYDNAQKVLESYEERIEKLNK